MIASSPSGKVANKLDNNIVISEFKIQSPFYIYLWINTFRKEINSLMSPVMGKIVSQLFFYKDSFGTE